MERPGRMRGGAKVSGEYNIFNIDLKIGHGGEHYLSPFNNSVSYAFSL